MLVWTRSSWPERILKVLQRRQWTTVRICPSKLGHLFAKPTDLIHSNLTSTNCYEKSNVAQRELCIRCKTQFFFARWTIKCLHESSRQSEGDIENLRAEARVSELMDHPFIIRIQKIAECNSRHYAVMPYIEGGSLSSLITSQPLSNRVAAGLLVNLCDAVSHMHRKGAIHCDLKPANVLLDEDGLPHIIDFGVARCIDQLTHSKAANTISGTPCYMSPEQALGDATSLGPHTDVYGLGAILYSVLTCRSPQNAETLLNIQLQALTANPTVPRKLNPAIDEELENICLDCLQKKPSREFPRPTSSPNVCTSTCIAKWLEAISPSQKLNCLELP